MEDALSYIAEILVSASLIYLGYRQRKQNTSLQKQKLRTHTLVQVLLDQTAEMKQQRSLFQLSPEQSESEKEQQQTPFKSQQ